MCSVDPTLPRDGTDLINTAANEAARQKIGGKV